MVVVVVVVLVCSRGGRHTPTTLTHLYDRVLGHLHWVRTDVTIQPCTIVLLDSSLKVFVTNVLGWPTAVVALVMLTVAVGTNGPPDHQRHTCSWLPKQQCVMPTAFIQSTIA